MGTGKRVNVANNEAAAALFAERKGSGLTLVDFCKSKGINAYQYYKIRNQLQRVRGIPKSKNRKTFIALGAPASDSPELSSTILVPSVRSSDSWSVELELSSGVKIRVKG